ncbi:MAG: hypothetical protein KDB07_12905, partial [Planctomycetes bacterium]|nr:hypothetical protein [Planctomycetota bacterium]
EIAALREAVKTSQDNYFRGLVCGVFYNIGDAEAATPLAKELAEAQEADGSVSGAKTSITRSSGKSLLIETTSIAILNWLHDDKAFSGNTEKAIRWLTEQCQNGRFGSTQGTVLALKAILA